MHLLTNGTVLVADPPKTANPDGLRFRALQSSLTGQLR